VSLGDTPKLQFSANPGGGQAQKPAVNRVRFIGGLNHPSLDYLFSLTNNQDGSAWAELTPGSSISEGADCDGTFVCSDAAYAAALVLA
jgi:hypothetical protein